MLRAAKKSLFSDKVFGASTISQQLARNLFLSSEMSFFRKIREAFLTYKLETKYSKKQILELYLNAVQLGAEVWGVENAAQYYFGISAKDLGIEQSLFLASLLASPSRKFDEIHLNRMRNVYNRINIQLFTSGYFDEMQKNINNTYFDLFVQDVNNLRKIQSTRKEITEVSLAISKECGFDKELKNAK